MIAKHAKYLFLQNIRMPACRLRHQSTTQDGTEGVARSTTSSPPYDKSNAQQNLNGKTTQKSIDETAGNSAHSKPAGIDVEKTFMRRDVQKVLRKMLEVDPTVLYSRSGRRLMGSYPTNIEEAQIIVLTDNELQNLVEKHTARMHRRLQIPPIMAERRERDSLICEDENLAAFAENKILFTDITYGVNPRKRRVFVREVDGRLRRATHDEHDRMLQIYFPLDGRNTDVPKLFDAQPLKAALDAGSYSVVLDRACLQFEPDSPEYIRACQHTYDHIDAREAYKQLQATRHYPGLIFYLAQNNRIDKQRC